MLMRIIAVSEFTKNCLIRELGYDPSRIDAIPHGIDSADFRHVSALECSLMSDLAFHFRTISD